MLWLIITLKQHFFHRSFAVVRKLTYETISFLCLFFMQTSGVRKRPLEPKTVTHSPKEKCLKVCFICLLNGTKLSITWHEGSFLGHPISVISLSPSPSFIFILDVKNFSVGVFFDLFLCLFILFILLGPLLTSRFQLGVQFLV